MDWGFDEFDYKISEVSRSKSVFAIFDVGQWFPVFSLVSQ